MRRMLIIFLFFLVFSFITLMVLFVTHLSLYAFQFYALRFNELIICIYSAYIGVSLLTFCLSGVNRLYYVFAFMAAGVHTYISLIASRFAYYYIFSSFLIAPLELYTRVNPPNPASENMHGKLQIEASMHCHIALTLLVAGSWLPLLVARGGCLGPP